MRIKNPGEESSNKKLGDFNIFWLWFRILRWQKEFTMRKHEKKNA